MLQTHVNGLAARYSQDGSSRQDRISNPSLTRHRAGIPGQRPYAQAEDPQEPSAQGQAGSDLEATLVDSGESCQEDRLLLMLDMTEALRPSELFALRWRSFDNSNTLSITETVYRRQIRPFGKTPKSLGKVSSSCWSGRRTPAVASWTQPTTDPGFSSLWRRSLAFPG